MEGDAAGRLGHRPPVVHGVPFALGRGSPIGRDTELDLLAELVTGAGERLVTVTGPPGVGKTRLACEAAARLADDGFADAALVDLTTISDPALVLPEIGAALGLRATSEGVDILARALSGRDVLLVLDNVEHVLPAASTISAVLAACPGLRVIATGRERLNLGVEYEVRIAPLATPSPEGPASAADLTTLAAVPAVALLLERVRRFDPGFGVTPDNRAAVIEVCRLLDGLPLALELAAARLRLFSPAELARLLRDRTAELDRGPGDAPTRHRDLDTAIGWSHDLLSEVERAIFRRTAVFVGGGDLDAMNAVCAPELDRGSVVDVVGSLIDKSLLGRNADDSITTRFRMLESVRGHAAARLMAADEDTAARERHAEHFSRWASRTTDLVGTVREGDAVAELGPERGNLLVALDHALAADLGPTVVTPLACAAGVHAFTRGRFGEGAALLDAVLPSVRESPASAPLAGVHIIAGATAYARGALRAAEAHLERGIAAADAVHSPRWRAFGTAFLGHVAGAHGHPDRAAAAYRRAGALYAQEGNATGEAWTRYDLGQLSRRRSDTTGATLHLRAALDSFRRIGYRWAVACSACALGSVELRHGEVDDAAMLFDEALTTVRLLDDHLGVTQCLEGAAAIAAARGRPRAAAHLLGAAESRRVRLDAPLPVEDQADRAALDLRLTTAVGRNTRDREQDAGRRSTTVLTLAHEVLGAAPTDLASLTAREREVARLVTTGRTDRQIARALGIAERTVNVHVRHVIRKLGARGRAGVAARVATGDRETTTD